MDVIDIILYCILGLLGAGIVLAVVFILRMRGTYKHTFIIKNLTGDKPFKIIDKAKEYFDKPTGVIYWKLLKKKHTIARPPSDALSVDDKGNYVVEAFYMGDVNYTYNSQDLDKDTLKKITTIIKFSKTLYKKSLIGLIREKYENIAKKSLFSLILFKPSPLYVYARDDVKTSEITDHKELRRDDKGKFETVKPFKPITTNQRLIAYDQIKKAYETKHKGLMQYIFPIAIITILVVLVAIVFIFGGEIIKPMSALAGQLETGMSRANDITARQAEITTLLAEIITERQYQIGTPALINTTAPD